MVYKQILQEQNQGHETRKKLYAKLETLLKRPVVAFCTSFVFPVMIEDADATMLEGILQKMDLSRGLALIINSPGGNGLAAERIINTCRSYSGTGEYWVIVPGKAKSAATMVSFGASKIIMGVSSELGPVDPQITIQTGGRPQVMAAHFVVESYKDLFKRAVEQANGHLEPYLQQLDRYDEREIKQLEYLMSLSSDIAVRALASGMMQGTPEDTIRQKINLFLSPEEKKVHGRPVYSKEAEACGLSIEKVNTKDELWKVLGELYFRVDNLLSTRTSKGIESKQYSFMASIPG